jgi:imidazolonepropionase-like amidohydrolase
MKLFKSQTLFDGRNEVKGVFVGFDDERIVCVGNNKEEDKIIAEGTVTLPFVDADSHIRIVESESQIEKKKKKKLMSR